MTRGAQRVFFYPHRYFRDRHLDTIRRWPSEEVVNREVFISRRGDQVRKEQSLSGVGPTTWPQLVPLLNLKPRPFGLARNTVVYTWGAAVFTGPFIVDLDNPYALTGYNLRAMLLYRAILRRILRGPRCVEIRCLSRACRETMRLLFGDEVYRKSMVHYPRVGSVGSPNGGVSGTPQTCRFLFVATQFEIKGGAALVKAFRRVYREVAMAQLDIVSHVPREYRDLVAGCPGITVHEARFTRDEIAERFLRHADVLVHPTYVESFGMVVLEALAQGLAVVATDVYALKEMVRDGQNGVLLTPPLSIWDGYIPSRHYYRLSQMPEIIRKTNTAAFEGRLANAMLALARDPARRSAAQRASRELFGVEFALTT